MDPACLHHVKVDLAGKVPGRRRQYRACAEGLGMHNVNHVMHCLGRFRIANKSVRVACFADAVPMLLSKLAADEFTQVSDDLREAG